MLITPFDPDAVWPKNLHRENHDLSGRLFACVEVRGVCVEVEPGDWLIHDGRGNVYPIPAEFILIEDLEAVHVGT